MKSLLDSIRTALNIIALIDAPNMEEALRMLDELAEEGAGPEWNALQIHGMI